MPIQPQYLELQKFAKNLEMTDMIDFSDGIFSLMQRAVSQYIEHKELAGFPVKILSLSVIMKSILTNFFTWTVFLDKALRNIYHEIAIFQHYN